MMHIIASSKIRTHYDEVSELCHSTGEPVYLTYKGAGDLVIMDIDAFSRREKQLALREKQLEKTKNKK